MINLEDLNERLLTYDYVRSISIKFGEQEMKYNLTLVMADSESLNADELQFDFKDVSSLNLKKFGGGLTQFIHLKVLGVGSGYDRVIYELSEVEHENIYFTFTGMSEY